MLKKSSRMAIGILSTVTMVWAADPGSGDPRIKALATDDAKARQAAVREFVEIGAPAIPALVAELDRNDPATVQPAGRALLAMVSRGTSEKLRKELSERLVAELAGKRRVETRRHICGLLGLVGDSECVDALYRLLMDAEVREDARQALVRIPSRSAGDALVAGLQITEGDFRVALVDAIAERKDAAAAPAMRGLAAGPEDSLAAAAIRTLGHLPDPASLQPLVELAQGGKPGAVQALLTLGETLADAGRGEIALRTFQAAAKLKSLTAAEYCAVLHGLARFDEPAGLQTLLDVTRDASKWRSAANHVRGAALAGLAVMPGQKATDAVADALLRSEDRQLRLDLLEVLGRRGSSMTRKAADVLARIASEGGNSVEAPAAIRAIARSDAADAIRPVLDALREPGGPSYDAAEEAVHHMTGPVVTGALIDELGRKDLPAGVKGAIASALGYRGDVSVVDALLKASEDPEVVVRAAAMKALGRAGGDKALERLVGGLGQPAGPDRDAAERALTQVRDESIAARLLAGYDQAPEARKAPLLRVLGHRGGEAAAGLLMKEAANPSAEIRAAAALGLSRLAEPDSQNLLLELAGKGPAEVTRAALPGLLAVARKLETSDASRASGLYTQVFAMGIAPELTHQALEGISRTAGPADADLIDILLPMLAEEEVPLEVSRAAARVAMYMPGDRQDEAVEVLQVAAMLLDKDPMVSRILEHLWKLGSDFDPARNAGFVTRWHLAGPFKTRGSRPWDECHFADARPDVSVKASIDGQDFEWKPIHTSNPAGSVGLVQALTAADGVACYAYAEMTVEGGQEAELRVGSDDGVVVWLNGERVLAVLEDRALTVDQNRVKVNLNAGVNRILVKSLNTFGGWEFVVRLMDLAGEPLL
ncbi:MAG TPA: HEAT repeat domain-containing protein [Phycisphaerae bacterium]|nr:HEAT repeat domain-containing protein [Phycisphaerae bacterium]